MSELDQFNNVNTNLGILAEECSEVTKLVFKSLRFGITDTDPDNPNAKPKYEELEQEIGDIMAMVDILINNGIGITMEGVLAAKARKIAKLPKFYGDFVNNNPK